MHCTKTSVVRAAKLRVGNEQEASVNLGSLIDAGSVEKVEEHVAEALCGNFFESTVLVDVTSVARIAHEESFVLR